jgi:DNA-directed RNA polymerase specialized sigma24 family protein
MQATQTEIAPRRPSLYDQSVEDAARAVRDAVDAIAAMTDPQARAKAASEVLKIISEANGILAKLRQEDIKTLRAAGLSYRDIGKAIGVHFTRVKQIESGVPTGNSSRARAAKESAGPEA